MCPVVILMIVFWKAEQLTRRMFERRPLGAPEMLEITAFEN